MAKILVIRFSAIGDVAMTIPVIYSFAVQYPQHQITVLSRNTLAPLFDGLPPNITFHGVDLKGEHAGIMGLEWIYKDLKKEHFDAVADFHDVLRSKYLRIRFRLAGVKVAHLDKGRSGKRKLVRARNKVMEWQKSSSCFKFTFLMFINPFARHETEVYNRHQTKTYIHYRVGYIPPLQ